MLAARKRPLPLLAALTLVLVIIFYNRDHADRIYHQWSNSIESHPAKVPANSTLGFGAVVVVSKKSSERRRALVQAANVTDVQLTIPEQPQWTEDDIQAFINGQSNTQRGSVLAWLGHHNALRWFLNSGLETALILEDDVDWDIRLRSIQIPLAASAARQLLPPQRSSHPFADLDGKHAQYWGNHEDWDLLYLGHCGDYFYELTKDGPNATSKRYNLTDTPYVVYKDYTLPMRSDLHPFTQALFGALQMPAHSRVFHRSRFPLCSFGYAVTRPAAERLLSDLAPPKLSEKGPRAFDVSLLHACNKGSRTPSPTANSKNPTPHPDPKLRHKYASPGLRCWTLNSELFHHMPGQSEIAEIELKTGGEMVGVPPVDLAGQAQVIYRNETTNIDCGFWSGAFAFDEEDKDQLRMLQQKVGTEGMCLKPGRKETDDTLQKLTS